MTEAGDLALVRLYWPERLRPAFDALMGVEAALADVVTGSSQPALGAIRLAWWREALQRLDHHPPPAEPRLQAVAASLLPLGIGGDRLAALEDGWAALLDEHPDRAIVEQGGARLFALAAELLGRGDPLLDPAGALYALSRARRLGLLAADADALCRALAGHRFARALRPLTALARLGVRDLAAAAPEADATPGRAAALLWHRLSGRIC